MASHRAGWRDEKQRRQEAEQANRQRFENLRRFQPGLVTRADIIERMDRGKAQASSPPHYNLRSQKHLPDYRERDEDDYDDMDEEEADESDMLTTRHQNLNTSHRSASDSSRLDYSGDSQLSSTASDSFSFHSGASPSAGTAAERMYPDLSKEGIPWDSDRSPRASPRGLMRRKLHAERKHSPPLTPKGGSLRSENLYPSVPPLNQSAEDTVCGIPRNWVYFLVAISILCVLLAVFIICTKSSVAPGEDTEEELVSEFDQFSTQLAGLKRQFPGQTERLWKVVRSCTRHVFDPEQATYPAVLLMVAEKKHAMWSSRLAEAVQQEFESVKLKRSPEARSVSLNLTSAAGKLDMDDQKLFLDRWLKERLDNGRAAVVVNHLESLLPEASLLLHGYCDGDNAPYKDVMLIWGLFLDRPVDTPQAAEEALRRLWMTEFMKDKIGALLSRIANNIVLVKGPREATKG